MTKPIKAYSQSEMQSVINRRLSGSSRGLGYLSAVEADARMKGKTPVYVKEPKRESKER